MSVIEAETPPWERGATETAKQWEGFCQYRDMGPSRSLAKVSRLSGKHVTLFHRWSVEGHWVERAEAWDREQDRIWRLEQDQARREAAQRHAELASTMLEKATARLAKFTATDVRKMTVGQLARLVEVGVKVERLARGDTTENLHHDGDSAPGVTAAVDLARRVLDDPSAMEAALTALDRAAKAS